MADMRTISAMLLLALASAACSTSGPTQEAFDQLEDRVEQLESELSGAAPLRNHEIRGSFTLRGLENVNVLASGCIGIGRYDGIDSQTGVVVRDYAGSIGGVSSLGDGVWSASACVYRFEVEVPDGLPFYTVAVAEVAEALYSLDDIEAIDWNISLSEE